MVAALVKGKRRIIGKNRLTDPAHIRHEIYPAIAGRHAELHVWLKAKDKIRGGILYVNGVRSSRNKNQMLNTRPCKYCMHIIQNHMNVHAIVYYLDGIPVKETL